MGIVGFGTGRLRTDMAYNAIRAALKTGYRFFDTAPIYDTEPMLADAIKDVDVNRSDLFIGTKVESQHLKPDNIRRQIDQSLKALETDYVDLLYVHWPAHTYDPERTFKTFEQLRDAGIVQSVGICNVTTDILEEAVESSPTSIDYVQIEFHPYLYQHDILEAAREHGAKVVAASPFAQGCVLNDPVVEGLAEKKDISPAMVVLAWCQAHGTVPIPCSSRSKHIYENFRAAEVNLTPAEVKRIDDLDAGERFTDYEFAPWNG
ncbi:aldehyde oxidoreductase [Natrinema sp. CBA1119]|nr:aldehyde oxidoreductase [Natrinema sp. CBA1119]PGF14390.1 aldehyde oxidoreductase [Natrinema sp. CBA1119]